MAGKNYVTGLIITGDASGAIKATALTEKALADLNGSNKRAAAQTASAWDKAKSSLFGMDQGFAGLAKSLGGLVGIVGVASFSGLIKSSIDMADNLKDLSKSTAISVEDLSGLQMAARQSGSELDAVAAAVNKLSVNIGKDSDKFKQLGIDSKSPLEAFAQLADLFVSIEDPQQRAAVGAAALGKSWADAAPLLSEGGASIRAMIADGREASGMTTEMANSADQFNDQLELMSTRIGGVAAHIAGEVLDGFNQLITKIQEASTKGVTFSSIMNGIRDFAFNTQALTELESVTKKIERQKEVIAAVKNDGVIGGAIDALSGHGLERQNKILDAYLFERETILKSWRAKEEKNSASASEAQKKVSAETLNDFVSSSSDTEKAAKKAASESQKHADAIGHEVAAINDQHQKLALSERAYEQSRLAAMGMTGAVLDSSMALWDSSKALEAQKSSSDKAKSEMDGLISKYNQLTMSARDYYASTLVDKSGAPMAPEQKAPLMQQFDKNAGAEAAKKQIEDTKSALDEYNKSLDSANTKTSDLGGVTSAIFDGSLGGIHVMAGAFDTMIKSIDKTSAALAENTKMQMLNNASKDSPEKSANTVRYAKEELKLNSQILSEKLSGARQIAGAVSSMLKQGSTEQQTAHAIEMGIAGAQMAMQIMKITGWGEEAIANTASTATILANEAVKGEAAAVTAVAEQAGAGPYIGFAMMAAMAAAMAGLGLMSGKSVGNSAPKPTSSPDTGTVLGDTAAKSNSVGNVFQLLKDIQAQNYPELRGINDGVAMLSSSITSVVTRLFQSGGVKEFAALSPSKMTGIGAYNFANPLANVGGYNMDPIGNFLIGGIFGGKQSQSVIGQGIVTNPTSLATVTSGGNLDARRYAEVQTKTSGGWFSSDKYSASMQYAALDASTQKALDDLFGSMGKTMLGLADALGMGLSERVRDYIIPALTVDLKGLSGEDAAKKLNGIISTALDSMSSAVFGDILGQYQKLGEGMLETAIRVVSEVAVVKDALASSGLSLGENAIATADALVQAAGGLKDFQQQFTSFFDKFFTGFEKQAKLYDTLTASFERLNISLPGTRDGYRKLVEALDLANAADRERYSMLLSMSSAADTYYTGLEDANAKAQQIIDDSAAKAAQLAKTRGSMEIQLMEAQGKTADALIAKRVDELAAMDASLRTIQLSIYAAQDYSKAQADLTAAIQKSVTEANAALDVAFSQLNKVVNVQIKAQQDILTALTGIADKIHAALASTSTPNTALTLESRAQAQAVIQSALDFAKGGGSLANFAGLEKALSEVSKPSSQLYSSFAAYSLDQAQTSVTISQLADYADNQVSVAQQSLTVLEQILTQAQAQVDNLKNLNTNVVSQSGILTDQSGILTNQSGILTNQSGILTTVNGSMLTVPVAMSNFTVKLDAATLAQTYAINTNTSATGNVNSAMQAFIAAGNNSTATQLALAQQAANTQAASASAVTSAATLQATASLTTTGAVLQLHATFANFASTMSGYMSTSSAMWASQKAAWTSNANVWTGFFNSFNYWNDKTGDNTTSFAPYTAAKISAAAAAANIPGFAIGINDVPYDMTAYIHKGERILPAADNKELMMRLSEPRSSRNDNAELVAEIRRLREEVAMLRAVGLATAGHANKTARILDRLMPDGDALAVRISA